jgi:CMP-N-acetylneuraminic acid synthetase
MANRRVIAFIFARGGSKGLPSKNVRLLSGKPLIAYAIDHALAVPEVNRVIVSTDSVEIASIAREFGAEVPFMRPHKLATDFSPELLSWRHALEQVRQEEGSLPSIMISVPVTAPLRYPEDIVQCLDLFYSGEVDVVVTVTEASRNPYFNMVTVNQDNSIELVVRPSLNYIRRQDTPQVYDMTTVAYVADPLFVLNVDSLFQGRVKAVKIPRERSIDIDTLLDFEIAEFLLSRRTTRK